ncbi:thioredoxin domain-containing protein [Bacteroides sp.]|uniref:thioredoxin domain-containing protein n=1 Tax=Bacteroides sp. TaxID=29523 RepID=UPI0025BC686C|nr:thioredoxin domain-containing protein [Bacteroides sp.]
MGQVIRKIYFCLFALCIVAGIQAQTQNTMTEVIPFKITDGKIIVNATVNGETADFVLDLAGHNALLPEAIKKLRINTEKTGTFSSYQEFVFKDVPVGEIYEMGTLAIGNNTFSSNVPAFILKDEPYLRKLGVMGVLNSAVFRTSVLTIDMQRKRITITQPYRPSYMKLNYRENFELITGFGVVCPITIQGKTVSFILDTWNDGLIHLTDKEFSEWSALYPKGTMQKVSYGYKEAAQEEESLILPETMFVKTKIENASAVKNPSLKRSVLGKTLLDYGILSIDYIHQKIYFQPFDLAPIPESEAKITEVKVEDGKMNPITRQFFLEHIFDYQKSNDFVYNGDKPVVIDFWATWCGPCMRLLPKMEELAEKYKGKVVFYKVNADKEKDLCNHFGVKALPTLFFIPVGGKPIVEVGATPEKYVQIIEEQLLK